MARALVITAGVLCILAGGAALLLLVALLLISDLVAFFAVIVHGVVGGGVLAAGFRLVLGDLTPKGAGKVLLVVGVVIALLLLLRVTEGTVRGHRGGITWTLT
jgi:hypothetical protein